jgi:hypothetical protein
MKSTLKSLDCWILILLLTGPTSSTQAFNIIFPAVHGSISDAAANAAGWNKAARDQIVANVYAIDKEEAGFNSSGVIHPTAAYRREHHFDRNPGITTAQAFSGGAAYVRQELERAKFFTVAGVGSSARMEAARGIHALEDLFAHSNWVDLPAADRTAVLDAVWDGAKMPPATLAITGYSNMPATPDEDAGLPPGDPRPHTNFALDKLKMNTYSQEEIMLGAVKAARHTHAVTAATAAATDFLQRVNNDVGALFRDNIRNAPASEPGQNETRYDWAALQEYDPNGFTVAHGGNSATFPAMALSEPLRAGMLASDDSLAGFDEDAVFTPTGERLRVFREIRPVDGQFASPIAIHIEYASQEVAQLMPGTLRLFYLGPQGEAWAPVSGAFVEETLHEVSFSAFYGGWYAIGGIAVPEPVSLMPLAIAAMLIAVARRRK